VNHETIAKKEGEMKKYLVACALFSLALALFSKNAFWKPGIKMTPVSVFAGQAVEFTAILNIEGEIGTGNTNYMQNLRFVVKVDDEVIHDKILYYFEPAVDYLIKANWVAKGGAHNVTFTVEAIDSLTPDSNPNDNSIQRTFSVYQTAPISSNQPQGTPTLPGKPQNLQAGGGANVQIDPCFPYQNAATDLVVNSIKAKRGADARWDFTAAVQNLGQRCVKTVEYELRNVNVKLAARTAGNHTAAAGYFLGAGQTRVIEGSFSEPAGLTFYYAGGRKYIDLEFIIDPAGTIPDPNRRNNSRKIPILIE